MYDRKRKSPSLNPGEILFAQCSTEKNLLYSFSSKRPCFPTAPHLTNDVNFSSNKRVEAMDTSTTGCLPYENINYKPRMCRMCAAGDSGHINHILN